MRERVLVTGADGFIGSHLVESLVREGYVVRAFVLYNSFNSWGWLDSLDKEILSDIEVVSGDIRDPFGISSAVEGCESVLHLAALIAIPYSYNSPSTYIETNVQGTLNIMQAARAHGLSKVVHTSTSEVYGTARFVPITEEHPYQPQSPYSASKIGADQVAMSYYHAFNLPVAVIRPFNTYGPRQSARAVIPSVITQIASGQKVLKLGSLTPTRDFNYVEDIVNGFIKVMESEKSVNEVINIGSNFEVSIGDLVSIISEVMGEEIRVISDEQRLRPENSEVNRLWADNSKARELIGWQPHYGGREGLRRGLQKTVEWFSEPKNLMKYKTDIYNI
ncbi:MAG: NAD-dependent 4,6-dehydratase LegB [Desulfobulbaceae bacterium]|nr:NAD-dependent 4,6-dehydratase LegB [Desulfobulbaceae bacterium]